MKKVVFLDIDGVLQPDQNHNRFKNNVDDHRGAFEGVFTDTFVYCPDVLNHECFETANKILE